MTDPRDERIDDLRRQLRALGYLDAGVDRFVLGGVAGTRGPIGVAARASARVGVLGGVLLGPAAAIGLGARLPGLVSGARDAVVLALYLGVLSFGAAAATAFVVSLIAALTVRARDERRAVQARRLSAAAGLLVTAACLMYLTLWWRNANAGFGWSAPAWTAFALAVAVGISFLLGHGVRISTLAASAASGGPGAALPTIPTNSWRGLIGGTAVAFAGAAIMLVLWAPADNPVPAPVLTVVATGMRVRLIAIDGFDLATYLDHYDAATRFSVAMHSAGVLGVQDTTDPARAWTTIATGALPDAHGVHALETRRVAGLRGILSSRSSRTWNLLGAAGDLVRLTRPSLASREERRVKAIWEVASDAGLRTAVVNWWATWPAGGGSGIVVSDRAVVRLEHGGALDAELSPAELYEPLRHAWPEIRRKAAETAAQAFADVGEPEARAALRRSAELDVTVLELLRALPGPSRDLDMVYLPGLDIAQHALLSPAGGAPTPSALAARVSALGSYYEFLQDLVEPWLSTDRDIVSILVTQPGRVETPTEGRIAATGSAAAIAVGTPLDVAPTIAYALGLPVSRELPGHPLIDLFARTFAEKHPVRQVDTWGRPSSNNQPRHGKPLDEETIDRLRSLGYVK